MIFHTKRIMGEPQKREVEIFNENKWIKIGCIAQKQKKKKNVDFKENKVYEVF